MTTHEHFEDLITEKLDGVISPADEKLLTDHFASCPDCREVYDLLSGAHEALDFEVDAPEELLPGVMQAVKAEKNRKKIRIRAFIGIVAAAAALAVAILPAAIRAGDNKADNDQAFAPFVLPRNGEKEENPGLNNPDDPSGNPVISIDPTSPCPIGIDPELYASAENWCASYRGVAWFTSLPEEITETAQEYRFANGDIGYDLTAEQFEALLDSALTVQYPNPDGDAYMAVIAAE